MASSASAQSVHTAHTGTEDKDFKAVFDSLLKDVDAAPSRLLEIVQAIFSTMSMDSSNAALQTAGVQALEKLASGGVDKASAIRGGIHTLVWIAEVHTNAEVLQESLCKVLRCIIICGVDSRAAVVSAGGVWVVVNAMTENLEFVAVQLAACKAMKELAARSTYIQDEICANSGVEAVLSAMERHPTISSIQEAGCGVLRNLSAGNAKHQNKIASLGGVRLVLVAMKLHSQEAPVQWAGCWALFCLTLQNVELQGNVIASGGLQHVLKAMGGNRCAPQVQEAGCWAIKVLTTADAEPSLGLSAFGAVCLAMQDHSLDEQVQKAGRAALQSPALQNLGSPLNSPRNTQSKRRASGSPKFGPCSSPVMLPSIPETSVLCV